MSQLSQSKDFAQKYPMLKQYLGERVLFKNIGEHYSVIDKMQDLLHDKMHLAQDKVTGKHRCIKTIKKADSSLPAEVSILR